MRVAIYLFFFIYLAVGVLRGARMILWPEHFFKPPPATQKAPGDNQGTAGAGREKNRARFRGAPRLAISLFLLSVLSLHFGWINSSPRVRAHGDKPLGTPAVTDAVTAKAESFFQEKKLIGLAVAIVTPNEEAIICLGRESLFGRDPVSEDTLFEIGSITKTFTGALLAKFIEEGKVELDQPLGSLLPPNANVTPEIGRITLRQLTTHTAGFPPMPANFMTPRRLASTLANRDPHEGYTEEEFRTALKGVKLEFTPGEKAQYSNFSSSLLGYLLATKEGSSYEAVVREHLLEPLAMKNTTIRFSPDQESRVATGYHHAYSIGPLRVARKSPPWTLPNTFAGAGALRSSISDMLKYLKANMGRGNNPLESALQRAQGKLEDGFGGGNSVGMNWIIREKNGQPDTIWHNGGTGGFYRFISFSADRKFGVVILNSSSESVDALGADLLHLLKEHAPEQPSPEAESKQPR